MRLPTQEELKQLYPNTRKAIEVVNGNPLANGRKAEAKVEQTLAIQYGFDNWHDFIHAVKESELQHQSTNLTKQLADSVQTADTSTPETSFVSILTTYRDDLIGGSTVDAQVKVCLNEEDEEDAFETLFLDYLERYTNNLSLEKLITLLRNNADADSLPVDEEVTTLEQRDSLYYRIAREMTAQIDGEELFNTYLVELLEGSFEYSRIHHTM